MAQGHRKRVREKALKNGVDSLLEHEFLEFCLYGVITRADTNPLAHKLLDKFGNIENVCNATVEELMEIKGIGRATAEFIRLIPSIARGYSLHTSKKGKKRYTKKEDIYRRCVALLKNRINETMYLICLNKGRNIIKETIIAEGEPGSVILEPRRVMDAIKTTATDSVMICHNHPSGVLLPSRQDFLSTVNIQEFLRLLNIELLDHIVVVEDQYISCIPVRD